MKQILLFGDPRNQSLSQNFAECTGVELFYPDIHVFPDHEKKISVPVSVQNKNIRIIKSISHPIEENLFEFVLFADTLKKMGASTVTAIIPFLAYQRSLHGQHSHDAQVFMRVSKLIESSIDSLCLIDPHDATIASYFTIPFVGLDTTEVFRSVLESELSSMSRVCIVSPDEGGQERANRLALALSASSVVLQKKRSTNASTARIPSHRGTIKKTAVIIDDICSTASTLIAAGEYLRKHGVEDLYICVTHPVFAHDAHIRLNQLGVKKVITTDSIPVPEDKQFDALQIVSTANILARSL